MTKAVNLLVVATLLLAATGSASVIPINKYAIDTGEYVVLDSHVTKDKDGGFIPKDLVQWQESFIYLPVVDGVKVGTIVGVSVGEISPEMGQRFMDALKYDENVTRVKKPYPGFLMVFSDINIPYMEEAITYIGMVDENTLLMAFSDNSLTAPFFFSQLSVHPIEEAEKLKAGQIASYLQ